MIFYFLIILAFFFAYSKFWKNPYIHSQASKGAQKTAQGAQRGAEEVDGGKEKWRGVRVENDGQNKEPPQHLHEAAVCGGR